VEESADHGGWFVLIETLEAETAEEIRRCFSEAFADYAVQVDFTLERYHQHILRNGVELGHSMGAYLEGRLVGFILNGTGEWNGKRTLYDAGTGVSPSARGQKVTEQIFHRMREHATAMGFEQYLLEVIQSNAAAIRIYEKQGFRTVRELCCFRAAKADLLLHRPFVAGPAEPFAESELCWECRPSWQNSSDSVRRFRQYLSAVVVKIEDTPAGYAVFGPETGEIVQLAVRPDLRGRGVGSSLLAGVADRTRSDKLTILNVEKSAETTRSFWTRRFQPFVDQYEMMLPLV
jgi:ribosomal protein S18 acetylase RimI-like enzyme